MRAEVILPLGTAGLGGDFDASFNHGLSNGSTFYLHMTSSNIITTMLSSLHAKRHSPNGCHDMCLF